MPSGVLSVRLLGSPGLCGQEGFWVGVSGFSLGSRPQHERLLGCLSVSMSERKRSLSKSQCCFGASALEVRLT